MAFTITSLSFYEFRIIGQSEGQAIINRWTYQATDESLGALVITSQDVLTALRKAWRDHVLLHLATPYAVQRYELLHLIGGARIIQGDQVSYPRVYSTVIDKIVGDPVTDVGSSVGPSLPTFVSATARVVTGFRGRVWKGSMRLSPITEDDSVDGGNTLQPLVRQAIETDLNLTTSVLVGVPPSAWLLRAEHFSPKTYFELGDPTQPVHFAATPADYEVNLAMGSQLSRKLKSYGR